MEAQLNRKQSTEKVRLFLRKLGFRMDKKPHQLDRLLLKSLSPESAQRLQIVWIMRNEGLYKGYEQYLIPETLEQAILLYSHDWRRYIPSLAWCESVVARLQPGSVLEVGTGIGVLLRYFQDRYPNLELQGIDKAENLTKIGSDLCGLPLIAGDYLTMEPDKAYDLILCNFGFDNEEFSQSTAPHSLEFCNGAHYCPSCSDHQKLQLDEYMKAWRRWAAPDASLAITGRIRFFQELRAFVLSAQEVGWNLSVEDSKLLKYRNIDGDIEGFPALIFVPKYRSRACSLEEVAEFYNCSLC